MGMIDQTGKRPGGPIDIYKEDRPINRAAHNLFKISREKYGEGCNIIIEPKNNELVVWFAPKHMIFPAYFQGFRVRRGGSFFTTEVPPDHLPYPIGDGVLGRAGIYPVQHVKLYSDFDGLITTIVQVGGIVALWYLIYVLVGALK